MIHLRYFDNRSLNPAWVKKIICLSNKVRIKMEGRDEHLEVPFSSTFEAFTYRQHLKLEVETCNHAPFGEVLIYLKSFGNFPLNLLKIESIACPENDCCVLIKCVDEEIESRFPFDRKSEALRFAGSIESLVDLNNKGFRANDSTGTGGALQNLFTYQR